MDGTLITYTPHNSWVRNATLGAALWLLWAVAVRPAWTATLLLLAPFVIVPLGLRLASRSDTGPAAPTLSRLAGIAPLVATTAAASFLPDAGALAALLSLPWLGFTLCLALSGVGRTLSRRTLLDPGIGADAGLMFVSVGGAWLTISRAGQNPLGFSDAIVQLTAVHFHYAGFALPIVASVAASRLERSALVPFAVIVGVPLTAIGITAGGSTEWFAATAMALAGMATAALLLNLSARRSGPSAWLIGSAGVALMAGMCMALGWAWSMRFGWSFLGLESMAAVHGSLNALGFGLLGLVGLNLSDRPADDKAVTMNMHVGRPSTGTLERLLDAARDHDTTNPIGLLGRPTPPGFRRKIWRREIGHGDFEAAAESIRHWRGHDAAGITRAPARPSIAVGETLALAIPVGPLSVTATCRIVDVVDEPDRYGFTYATLPHHPVDGEESFIITQRDDGALDVTVTAVWRPAIVANHVCPPLTRILQDRAINRYLDGIAAIHNESNRVTA